MEHRFLFDKRIDVILDPLEREYKTDGLLSPRQFSKWIGLTVSSLAAARCRGDGPPYIKISPRRVKYSIPDVRIWLRERMERQAEAEAGGRADDD